MISNHIPTRDIRTYSDVAQKLRQFFLGRGFVEVHTQDRLSILAACEDPTTVATYQYEGNVWPLPQTGQMWLEYELLTKPELPGVFCMSTSFRNERNPIPGRHERIFPMFEFESRGTFEDLRKLEEALCEALGLGRKKSFKHFSYRELALKYKTRELTSMHETNMEEDYGRVVFIDGMETIGSAERSSNVGEMRERFHSISGGGYAALLYKKFGKRRVIRELEEFLSLTFFPRCGGGIGMTRLMKACTLGE